MANEKVFDHRAENYAKTRPGYAPEVMSCFLSSFPLPERRQTSAAAPGSLQSLCWNGAFGCSAWSQTEKCGRKP